MRVQELISLVEVRVDVGYKSAISTCGLRILGIDMVVSEVSSSPQYIRSMHSPKISRKTWWIWIHIPNCVFTRKEEL